MQNLPTDTDVAMEVGTCRRPGTDVVTGVAMHAMAVDQAQLSELVGL